MGKETGNEFAQNGALIEDESTHALDHSNTLASVKSLDGTGDQVQDIASLDARIEVEDPLLSGLDGGVSQQSVSEMENLEAEDINGRASDTQEPLFNDKEDPHFVDFEEIISGEDGIPAPEVLDGMDIKGSITESMSEDVDQVPQHPTSEDDQGGEDEIAPEQGEPVPKQMSKSALKQLAKRERYKEVKMQRKAAEKEKRHQETARKRREWEEKLATLTEEEKEKARFEKLSLRKERKDEQNSRKEKLKQSLETGQNIVIDLEFSELMKPNEITSLIQQVMYSYAANGRAPVPGRISLTGVRGDIRKELEKISGFSNWLIHKEEESYMEVFKDRQSDLVYLTADSGNILESLDSTKIYIIGGLVDRNRWKNITLEKATQQKIATAKLPIGDHLKMMASQVLTVNQVVELLLCFLDVGDWKKSLMKVVPVRKRAAEESFQGSGE
ncbi:unnamed protein product [Calypogeia fissa]